MAGKERFEKLLEPFQIGRVKLRNRMVKPGQILNLADEGNYAGDRIKAFYEELARGGVGLIIVESTCIDFPLGVSASTMPRLVIDDDKFIPRLQELAGVIHKHGCPTFLQLGHAGPAHPGKLFGTQPVAASSLSDEERPEPSFGLARELTIPEIHTLEDKFTEAAERAKKAGFDGVELHGGHRYLINSFLSRAWNKRQDAYGCQDLESRTRFAVEIIGKIKKVAGKEFVVGVRYNGGEWGLEKGISAEECQSIGRILENAGADFVHLTGYGYGPYALVQYPEYLLYPETKEVVKTLASKVRKPGALVTRAEMVKKAVSIPVIGVGRLGPELGEWLLEKGKVDLIALGRRLMADPHLPNKVASGKLEDIRPCTACLECISAFYVGGTVRCSVNAALGKEREYALKPADKKKRVLVVGGGPGGMEAARVAALRGHEVTLYEKDHKLGGLLVLASLIKGIEVENLLELICYFRIQIKKLGIRVKLGKEVNLNLIEKINPDAVILATGSLFDTSQKAGSDRTKVITSAGLSLKAKALSLWLGPTVLGWLTRFWLPLGRKVVIMGGQMRGCQMARFLVNRGRKVTIVEDAEQIGTGIPYIIKPRLLAWLAENRVTILTGVKYEEITAEGLFITTKGGGRQLIQADTVLDVAPPTQGNEFFETLKKRIPEVYMVGGGGKSMSIIEAIADGSRIGHAI